MSEPRAFVRNAADPHQVRRAARKERTLEQERRAMLRAVLDTPEGRYTLWALLESLGVFRSIWDNSARIHYNAGRQDAGHELMALIIAADPNRYEQMEREARARAKRLDQEMEAPASEEVGNG